MVSQTFESQLAKFVFVALMCAGYASVMLSLIYTIYAANR